MLKYSQYIYIYITYNEAHNLIIFLKILLHDYGAAIKSKININV
jgi:hypothetical protein